MEIWLFNLKNTSVLKAQPRQRISNILHKFTCMSVTSPCLLGPSSQFHRPSVLFRIFFEIQVACTYLVYHMTYSANQNLYCNHKAFHMASIKIPTVIIPTFFFRKKGYINFVPKSVRLSVCLSVRPSRFL